MMVDMAAHVVFQKPLNRKALATSLAWEVQLGILDGKDIISNCKSLPFFLISNFRKRQIALYSPCRLVGRSVDVTIDFFQYIEA